MEYEDALLELEVTMYRQLHSKPSYCNDSILKLCNYFIQKSINEDKYQEHYVSERTYDTLSIALINSCKTLRIKDHNTFFLLSAFVKVFKNVG